MTDLLRRRRIEVVAVSLDTFINSGRMLLRCVIQVQTFLFLMISKKHRFLLEHRKINYLGKTAQRCMINITRISHGIFRKEILLIRQVFCRRIEVLSSYAALHA